jgi:hypothetical protein
MTNFSCFQNATVLKRTYTPPPLSPYATKYQINQSVFADNKYRRYDIEVEDDEAETMEAPIKVILLKTMEGKTLSQFNQTLYNLVKLVK